MCKLQELKLCDAMINCNDEFLTISSAFSNIFPVLVSYITVLHFILCLISHSSMVVFVRVFTIDDLGQKACSEQLHPFPRSFSHL